MIRHSLATKYGNTVQRKKCSRLTKKDRSFSSSIGKSFVVSPLSAVNFLPTHQWTISIVFILINNYLSKCSPKSKTKNFNTLTLESCLFPIRAQHTHTHSSSSLTPLECNGMRGAIKKHLDSTRNRTDSTVSAEIRKAVPAVTVRCWHKGRKIFGPVFTTLDCTINPRLKYCSTPTTINMMIMFVCRFLFATIFTRKKKTSTTLKALLHVLRASVWSPSLRPSSSFSIHAHYGTLFFSFGGSFAHSPKKKYH